MMVSSSHILKKTLYVLFFIAISLLISSCDNDSQPQSDNNETDKSLNDQQTTGSKTIKPETVQAEVIIVDPQSTIKKLVKTPALEKDQASWDTIKSSGTLRIIVPNSFQFNEYLPRKSLSYNNELKLIVRFAENHNLEPMFVTTQKYADMLALLQQGYGDVVAANMTILDSRKTQVDFTIPVDYSIEQLVVARSNDKAISIEQLNGLKIGVKENTSFWETISSLKNERLVEDELLSDKHPAQDFEIVKLNDKASSDDKFNLLVAGKIDAVVEDSNRLSLFMEYRDDIKAVLDLNEKRPIAWAVRKNSPVLLKQLNSHIKTEKLVRQLPEARPGDLDSIKQHRQLRLITRNNASTYFLWKNNLMGFEYELIKHFAKQQKLNLKVLVAQDTRQMLQWLEEGYGDIVSAGMVKTPERESLPVNFTDPYLFVKQVIVQRKNDVPITSIKELDKRTFHVRKSSSYWHTLNTLQQQLSKQGVHFNIELVPEKMETEEIIKQVIDGQFDLTLADSHIIDIEKSWHNTLLDSLPLSTQQGQHWLVRKDAKLLLSELNKFIEKEYKKLFYNITYNKYFKNSRKLFNAKNLENNNKAISAYDDLIKSLSREYNFDWRLIAAQINKESQFNPKAESWAGAKGLLQVMPRTAREVGIDDLEKPENGLRAGIKYMNWISKQLSDDLPADVHTWFTLAAYNAGLGHLRDARNLAVKQGLDPNRWFGHVEKTFLLLSKPEYYKKARYGYVRGTEPVNYIKTIQALYELYTTKHPEEA